MRNDSLLKSVHAQTGRFFFFGGGSRPPKTRWVGIKLLDIPNMGLDMMAYGCSIGGEITISTSKMHKQIYLLWNFAGVNLDMANCNLKYSKTNGQEKKHYTP